MIGLKRRTAVLISGRGSNLAALIAAAGEPDYPAEIALAVSNRPGAGGLARAQEAGIETRTIDHKAFRAKQDFEAALDTALRGAGVEIVCLAGFMRLLSAEFVERWRDRLLNVHPSLMPAFPGLDTHARALAARSPIHGATVHLVRPAVDSGPIVVQGAVPILAGDTPDSLAGRVLAVEHRILPLALALIAGGGAQVTGERVTVDPAIRARHPDLIFPADSASPA